MNSPGVRRRLLSPMWWALSLVCLALCAACQSGGGNLNVARAASLSKAALLEILEGDGTSYVSRRIIAEPSAIQALAGTIDSALPLGPRARCVGQYLLRFQGADGQVQEFEYYCQSGTSFLRGGQAYWRGLQVVPPAGFDAAVRVLLAP